MYKNNFSSSSKYICKQITLYVFLFILISPVSFCQQATHEPSPFDKAFFDIYINTASKDLPLALKRADSLHKSSGTDLHRLRSLMLTSDVFKRMDNADSSIRYLRKASVIARKLNDHDWLARIYGALSTQHREMGLLKQGKKYLDSSIVISNSILDTAKANQYKGLTFQEIGFYNESEGKSQDAIKAFEQAESYFVKLRESTSRNFFLAQNEERIGENLSRLKNYREALKHYKKAATLDSVATKENTPLRGIILNGLGYAYMALKEYPKAGDALKSALQIAETSNFSNLKISAYNNLSQYYLLTGNETLYKDFNLKYEEALMKQVSDKQGYIDNLLDETLKLKDAAQQSSRRVIYVSFALFAVLIVSALFWYRKQRNDYRVFKKTIERLSSNLPLPTNHPETEILSSKVPEAPQEKELISEPVKAELLAKLEEFENSAMFTESNMSIAILAGKLNTNTKYLSHIINRYRDKDFNSYINELRIEYLLNKMKEDNRYTEYKLSYLAKEIGFSSHSQFATVFKSITGLPPSTFISYLKKSEKPE